MRKVLGLVVVGMLLAALPAMAAPITYNVNSTVGGNSVSASAQFDFTGDSLVLTLSNLTVPTSYTNQELVGISWFMGSSVTATLTGVTALGSVVDCSGDHTYPCVVVTGTPPVNYDWAVTGSGILAAGDGSWKPYAIINSAYTLPANGNGNLANSEHNPLLTDAVQFTFQLSSGDWAIPSDVMFYWGTNGTGTCSDGGNCPSAVPEPESLFLLGTGLLGAGFLVRRKRA